MATPHQTLYHFECVKMFSSQVKINHTTPVRPTAVFDLCFFSALPSRRRGISLPADTVEKMTQIIIVQKPASLTEFLGKFDEYMHVVA